MEYVELGNVCRKGSSNIAQKDIANNTGDYPIYGASGLIKNVDFFQQKNPCVAVVKDGAGVGRAILLPARSSVIGTMQYLIPEDTVDVKYLYYAVSHMNLARYYTGATIPHIYFKDYRKELMPLPPLAEQHEITYVLTQVDTAIDICNRILSALDELVKSQFIGMFGDLVLNPHDYSMGKLTDVATIVSGITKGRKTKNTNLRTVPYLSVANVKDGLIDWNGLKTIEATEEEIAQYQLFPDDILMTEGGDPDKLGRGCSVGDVPKDCIYQNHLFRVRLDKALVNPCFFEAYIKTPFVKRYLLWCAKQTTGIASINKKQLGEMPVVRLSLDQQYQFAAFVQKSDKAKSEVKRIRENVEYLKAALVQKYFG